MTVKESRLWPLLLLAPLLLAGCGVVRPPLPPSLDLPQPVQDLRAVRKADRVTFAWTLPNQTTDNLSIRHMGATRICRRQDSPVTDCTSPVRELTVSQLSLALSQPARGEKHPAQQQAMAVDNIDPAVGQADPTGFYSYAVETLNDKERSAGLSNQVQISLAPSLPPPGNLTSEVTAQGVMIRWSLVATPQTPGLTHIYRIYRRNPASKTDAVAGELPLEGTTEGKFVDGGVGWGTTYLYRITIVTTLKTDELGSVQVEGADSDSVEVRPVDIYPPAPPKGLQAVYSGVGQRPFIDLTWSANTEPDLAGYNVYRREEGTTAVKLNTEPLKTPAYRDSTVTAGKRYLYSVSAVDVRGNESAKSEEAAESTLP